MSENGWRALCEKRACQFEPLHGVDECKVSKVQELLRDYTAPLEDNYGKTTYDAVLASLEIKIREAIAEEVKNGR